MRIVHNSAFIFWVFVALCFAGCTKDNNTPDNKSYKIVFKAEASNGSTLNMAVYGYDATLTTLSNIGGITWTSPEITTKPGASVASVSLNAMGLNASSTLKVEIFVDGVLKKEGTSSGTALSANARFDLK